MRSTATSITHRATPADTGPDAGPAALSGPAPSARPGLESLVGKSRPDETLVTDWSMVSDTLQRVTVRWPRDHSFYTANGRYSPLIFTESLRQALALLTHSVHEVPLTHRTGWEYFASCVDPAALAITPEPGLETVTLLISHLSVKRRRLGSVHLTSTVEARRGEQPIGAAELRYSAHPPALYDRLRGTYAQASQAFGRALPLTPAVPAALVGRPYERDVVLSPTAAERTWQLRVDVGHGVLFDHPHDHVPGMVLLEAAVQAAQACADRPVVATAFETEFHRYVEFDRRCLVTAEHVAPDSAGRDRVRVTATQEGRPVFSATVATVPLRRD